MRWFLVCLAILGKPSLADTSRFDWTGTLAFDPARPVANTTLGTLLQALGADTADAGSVTVSGQLAYRTDLPAGAANTSIGAWPQAVTEMTLRFGAVDLKADFGRIAPHAASSLVGTIARADGGFCGDADHCAMAGLRPPGWGNQVTVLNDAGHVYLDETGQNPLFGDGLGFMVGRTSGQAEFVPAIQTANHGVVAVDGLYLLFFASPGRQFVSRVELPIMAELTAPGLIGRSEISLFIEVPGLVDPLRIEGVVNSVTLAN